MDYEREPNPLKLPSTTLQSSDLRELDKILDETLHEGQITVVVSREGFEAEYPSITDLLNDSLSPSLIYSFEIQFESAGGSCRIVADSHDKDRQQLYVEGYERWCAHIQNVVENYMQERKNTIRTYCSGRDMMGPIAVGLSIVVGHFFITLSPLGIFYPAPRYIPRLSVFLGVTAAALFGVTFRHSLFPYAYWTVGSGVTKDLYAESRYKLILLSIFMVMMVHALRSLPVNSITFG